MSMQNLTDETIEAVAEVAAKGGTRAAQAAAAGISRRTLSRWIATGRRAADKAENRRSENEHRAVDFLRALTAAEAKITSQLLSVIMDAALKDRDVAAAKWLLTTRYPADLAPPGEIDPAPPIITPQERRDEEVDFILNR